MSSYTTSLRIGKGMIAETGHLLNLWQDGMDKTSLEEAALQSGAFPNMSARRLHNVVEECFATRYLYPMPQPAKWLKELQPILSSREFNQLLFLYTCRANDILADFVRQVYWPAYAAGKDMLGKEEAYDFVNKANQDGMTTTFWSENTVRRAAGDLTSTCADFGLLERGSKSLRRIQPYRIEQSVYAVLSYDLHFSGLGDNSIVSHPDWALFGLEPSDVVEELKRLSLKGWVIVQAAGNVIRIGWEHNNMEEVVNALT